MFEYTAEHTKTIDGDTIDAVVDLGFHIKIAIRVRLSIIDTPEKDEPGWKEATSFTTEWFKVNKNFILRTEHDKAGGFNRWLGTCVSLSGESLNKLLLDNGLATVYSRDKK